MSRLPLFLCVILAAGCGSRSDQPKAAGGRVTGTYIGDKEQLQKDSYLIRQKLDAASLDAMSAEERQNWQRMAMRKAADLAAGWDLTFWIDEGGRFRARVVQQGAPTAVHEGTWTRTEDELVCEVTRTVDELGRPLAHDWPKEWMTFRFRVEDDVLYLPVPSGMAFEYVLRREN